MNHLLSMDGNGRVEIPLVVKPNKSARPKIYDNRAAGADISWASVVVVTGGIEMYWIPPPKVTWPQLLIFPHAIAKPRRRTAGTRWIISRCKRGIWGSNHLQRCGVKTNLLCLRKAFPQLNREVSEWWEWCLRWWRTPGPTKLPFDHQVVGG